VAAFSVLGLRPGDNNRTSLWSPRSHARYDHPTQFLGGVVRLTASSVSLHPRPVTGPPASPLRASTVSGSSIGLDWRLVFTSDPGLRVKPFADVRLDGYHNQRRSERSTATTPPAQSTPAPDPRPARGRGRRGQSPIPSTAAGTRHRNVLEPLFRSPPPQIALRCCQPQSVTASPSYFDEDSIALEFRLDHPPAANSSPLRPLLGLLRLNVAGRGTSCGRRPQASAALRPPLPATGNSVFAPGSGLNHGRD